MKWSEPLLKASVLHTPTIKNHSVTYFDNHLYCFGGYDGRRNHTSLVIYSIREQRWMSGQASGNVPPGRNGHTATLADEKIVIIGGWLGSGPLAANDTHVLDLSYGVDRLRWFQPSVRGLPPGPCNMHSADYVESLNEVFVFRGGNGREYLNDLHALHVNTYEWRKVEATGEAPQQRANHSSAVINETGELFIFGGWNGKERLNDIHILDTKTSVWSRPIVGGVLPHPRAGMTLTALRDRLYLFGGSGTSSKCFHDLQILDTKEMVWLDVTPEDEVPIHHCQRRSHYNPMDSCPRNAGMERVQRLLHAENDGSSTISHQQQQQQEHRHASNGATYERHPPWQDMNSSSSMAQQHNNANPNDTDSVQSIIIHGQGPGRRAGHTATAVNRHIFVFGGSCGSDYLNDFLALDTDPPHQAKVEEPSSLQLFERRLKHFFNDEEFSDVTFLVEGKHVYGHRIVLSLVSDCFRAMFTNGFRESTSSVIPIPFCSYEAFMTMMEYIYTGQQTPQIIIDRNNMNDGIEKAVELLELADQFFLDHLKQVCERILQPAVCVDTIDYLLSVAEKTNARQLQSVCRHFQRNQDHIVAENQARRELLLLQQQQLHQREQGYGSLY